MAVEFAVVKNQSSKMYTKPGFLVYSSSFIIQFTAVKVKSEEEELVDNWCNIMFPLVKAFERWPRDMARIEREAADSKCFDIMVKRVKIDHTFSRIKRVCVYMEEVLGDKRSKLIFFVKKKQEMKTLQTLAAEKISNCVSKKKDFEHLEVPKPLLADLNEAYDNIWRVNLKCYICKGNLEDTDIVQCPSNMTHLFCYTCCWNFIFYKRHKFFKQNRVVFCPSDERCPLRGSTDPWTFRQDVTELVL